MKHKLQEVEKLTKEEAWQLLRGDKLQVHADVIEIDDDGVPLNPFMSTVSAHVGSEDGDSQDDTTEAKNSQ
jgi:hypothetical protein